MKTKTRVLVIFISAIAMLGILSVMESDRKVAYANTPNFSLSGVSEGGFTNGNVTLTWNTGGWSGANLVRLIVYQRLTGSELPEMPTVANVMSWSTAGETLFTINLGTHTFTEVGHYRVIAHGMNLGGGLGLILDSATFSIDRATPSPPTLIGVTNGGITNSNVTVGFNSPTITGVMGGGLSRAGDSIWGVWSRSDSPSVTPAVPTTAFSGATSHTFTTSGNYRVRIRDSAGNFVERTFIVDREAPTLTLTGVADGGATNATSISASWSDSMSGIREVRYARATGAATPTAAQARAGNLLSGTSRAFTLEGNYRIIAIDNAGNETSQTFIIDRTAPTLTLSGVTSGGFVNTNVTVSWSDALSGIREIRYVRGTGTTTPTVAGARAGTILSGNSNVFSLEGRYRVVVIDNAGNEATQTFNIDRTAPNNNVSVTVTNQAVTFAPTDTMSGVSFLEVRHGTSGTWQRVNATSHTINNIVSNNGRWYVRVTDIAGNRSAESVVTLFVLTTFGNLERIQNTYFQNYWWTVSLPATFFNSVAGQDAGIYSFATLESARSFALYMEEKHRVTRIPGGWIYVNAGNDNQAEVYHSRDALMLVLERNAFRRVSERQIARNILNNNLHNQVDNLHHNIKPTPQVLINQFGNLPTYFVRPDFMFEQLNLGFALSRTAEVQLVATTMGGSIQSVSRAPIPLTFGVSLVSQLTAIGSLQGFYLVRERCAAGNLQQYFVFIDLQAPTLEAYATFGNGTSERVIFDEANIELFAGTFRYLSLDLRRIFDNADPFVVMRLTGRGFMDVAFVQGDTLPYLCGVTHHGRFTITLYDRSGNTLEFEVIIAGEVPFMRNTSLTNENQVTLSVVVNDSNNSIVELRLYRLRRDGSREQLLFDCNGTPVNVLNLSYVLRIGGEYTMVFRDLFGRTIEAPSVFYQRGLPSGILTGVQDGGITNRNVGLRYSGNYELRVYRLYGGVAIPFGNFTTVSSGVNMYTTTIAAVESNNGQFVFYLINPLNDDLFIRYTFEIDTIVAEVFVRTIEGYYLEFDSATNVPFYVFWLEYGVRVRQQAAGQFNSSPYEMRQIITTDGLFTFSVTDRVGNNATFTIRLDTRVEFRITGEHSIISPGNILARNALTFTVMEVFSYFSVYNSSGFIIENGGTLMFEGVYVITVVDSIGNRLVLSITLDFTPPTITLFAVNTKCNSASGSSGAGDTETIGIVNNGQTTRHSVKLDIYDYSHAFLVDKQNRVIRAVYSGEIFSNHGEFRILARDLAGNQIIVTFAIDTKVEFSANVVHNQITTSIVNLNFLEALYSLVIKLDGLPINTRDRFLQAGTYAVHAVDMVRNELHFVFTIVPTVVREFIFGIPSGLEFLGADVGGYIKIRENGSHTLEFVCSDTRQVFSVTIVVDNDLPTVTILRGAYFVIVSEPSRQSLNATLTRDGTRVNFNFGARITVVGNYVLLLVDDLGNTSVYTFSIYPQTYTLTGVENGGVTAGHVRINLFNVGAANLVNRLNQIIRPVSDGETFTAHGEYRIIITGAATQIIVTFAIDTRVYFDTNVQDREITSQNVSFVFTEYINSLLVWHNGSLCEYLAYALLNSDARRPFVFNSAGAFEIFAVDKVGNELEFGFTIIPTRARALTLTLPSNISLSAKTMDNIAINISEFNGRVLNLRENGYFELVFFCEITKEYFVVSIQIDTTPPTADISKNNNFVIVSNPSANIQKATLTRDGQAVNFRFGGRVEGSGNFRLELIDDIGNISVYYFVIEHRLNAAAWAFIIVASALSLFAAITIIRARRKPRVA